MRLEVLTCLHQQSVQCENAGNDETRHVVHVSLRVLGRLLQTNDELVDQFAHDEMNRIHQRRHSRVLDVTHSHQKQQLHHDHFQKASLLLLPPHPIEYLRILQTLTEGIPKHFKNVNPNQKVKETTVGARGNHVNSTDGQLFGDVYMTAHLTNVTVFRVGRKRVMNSRVALASQVTQRILLHNRHSLDGFSRQIHQDAIIDIEFLLQLSDQLEFGIVRLGHKREGSDIETWNGQLVWQQLEKGKQRPVGKEMTIRLKEWKEST